MNSLRADLCCLKNQFQTLFRIVASWVQPTQILTDAPTITWNVAEGITARVTLTDDRLLDLPTNIRTGEAYVLIVEQGADAPHLLTYNAAIRWPADTPPTLPTGEGERMVLTFLLDEETLLGCYNGPFSVTV